MMLAGLEFRVLERVRMLVRLPYTDGQEGSGPGRRLGGGVREET